MRRVRRRRRTGFAPRVREEALVAAARHCCVCHRYKGVKVEVHHIIPESRGGGNDLDNAIALCFDCHADAGHYNPRHPRGTRFSPEELRAARNEWHAIVRRGPIETPGEEDTLYCRYLICKNFEAFREVAAGDLSRLPVNQPLLVTNDVHRFHAELIANHPFDHRPSHAWGDAFDNREAYARVHPEVRIVERSSINLYPYFEAIRRPSIDEIQERVAPGDVVTRLLVEGGVLAGEISLVLAYDEVCGGNHFQEIYLTRPLWSLYLALTNVQLHPVTLHSLIRESERPDGLGYRYLTQRLTNVSTEERLPAAPIPPGTTVVMPLATLLGPLEDLSPEVFSQYSQELEGAFIQTVSHADFSGAHLSTALIGPGLWPLAVQLLDRGILKEQRLHQFDLSRLYTIDRSWQVGSCPHLFAVESADGTLKYLGELFARQAGITQAHRVLVPPDVVAFVIAELEAERTVIDEVSVNGEARICCAVLNHGESVTLEVKPGDEVTFVGHYEARISEPQDPWLRNCVIRQYITLSDGFTKNGRPTPGGTLSVCALPTSSMSEGKDQDRPLRCADW